MTNLPTLYEAPRPADGLVSCVFNGLVTAKTENDSFEAWIAALAKLGNEPELAFRVPRDPGADNYPREVKGPLQKLAAGPWVSLGGYFDYSLWPDRDRFMELDKAIAASQESRETRELTFL